uniref:Uncharacterized protein n=1 Tax=Rhizophora mucronata TaxID=61149 RepID=A0A2P2NNP6_RHIMU
MHVCSYTKICIYLALVTTWSDNLGFHAW